MTSKGIKTIFGKNPIILRKQEEICKQVDKCKQVEIRKQLDKCKQVDICKHI